MMRTTATMLTLLVLLLCAAGCGNKIDSKLSELADKPRATTVESAKALYDEVNELIRWTADPKNEEKMTPAQLAWAQALRNQRRDEGLALVKEKAVSGVVGILGGIGIDVVSIDAGKARDWFLGFDDPRFLKHACIDAEGGVLRKGEPGCPP